MEKKIGEKMAEKCVWLRLEMGGENGGPRNFLPRPTKTQSPQIGEKIGRKTRLAFSEKIPQHQHSILWTYLSFLSFSDVVSFSLFFIFWVFICFFSYQVCFSVYFLFFIKQSWILEFFVLFFYKKNN